MTNSRHDSKLFLSSLLRVTSLAVLMGCVLTTVATQPAKAQAFSVLHAFTGGQDGGDPAGSLTMDKAGSLYGTTYLGGDENGSDGCGTAYRLKRSGTNYVADPLYILHRSDGCLPTAGVVFGPNGTLYGTASSGELPLQGTAFNLRTPPSVCKSVLCLWTPTIMYGFGANGTSPGSGVAVFDGAGNIYNTTTEGGDYQGDCFVGCGTVYQLTPSGGAWTETVLYNFTGANGDGRIPMSGVIFDQAGNLYGTTYEGGSSGNGTVYELSPSSNGWTERVIYSFTGYSDGAGPVGTLIMDRSGNLYGSTYFGNAGQGGTVFELSPTQSGWTYQLIYAFNGQGGPTAALSMDAGGNLYGTTSRDGANLYGNVFELSPSSGGWTYRSLYDFTAASDGFYPASNVIFDANGNLYGTASAGGAYDWGVAWELAP